MLQPVKPLQTSGILPGIGLAPMRIHLSYQPRNVAPGHVGDDVTLLQQHSLQQPALTRVHCRASRSKSTLNPAPGRTWRCWLGTQQVRKMAMHRAVLVGHHTDLRGGNALPRHTDTLPLVADGGWSPDHTGFVTPSPEGFTGVACAPILCSDPLLPIWLTLIGHKALRLRPWPTLIGHKALRLRPWLTLIGHKALRLRPWPTLIGHKALRLRPWLTVATQTVDLSSASPGLPRSHTKALANP